MHAHFVLAHSEPKSFNAHLGTEAFVSNGWATSVSDPNTGEPFCEGHVTNFIVVAGRQRQI